MPFPSRPFSGLYQLRRKRTKKKNPSSRRRSRRRRGHPKENKSLGEYQTIISEEKMVGCSAYHPRMIRSELPGACAAMQFKHSLRWIESECRTPALRTVPYISKCGKITGHAFASWVTYPQRLLASVIATIYRRLWVLTLKRHGMKVAKSKYSLLLKVAAVYANSHSDRLLNGFLGITRKRDNWKLAHTFVDGFAYKLDESQRFVVNQVYLQTYWFTSRSERPRDKSKCIGKKPMYKIGFPPYTDEVDEAILAALEWLKVQHLRYGQ